MNQTKTTTTVAAPEKAASRPEVIRAWVSRSFQPKYVEQVTQHLIDVAAGNLEGNTFEKDVIKMLFPLTENEKRTRDVIAAAHVQITEERNRRGDAVDTAPPAGKNGESVWHRFLQVFDRRPSDMTLQELPVNSNCGRDCVKAITAGKRFMNAAEPSTHHLIIKAAEETCIIFWRG